ncbi:hypothetical protein SAMN05444161_7538 [Rhizobiales bacterium GAS191]|nr:hypothetical protein SAMN05444161_7538 [Rhizobiales bacterium GAS191]
MANSTKNASSLAKRGSLPPKATHYTASSIGKALASEPPAKRGLTKFEALRCEQCIREWEAYPALEHVYVGYVDARSFGGQAIVVDVEDDFERWAHKVDPFVDKFGDPIPNDEADDRIALNLTLPTAKRLMQLLQEAVATLEIEKELVDAYYEIG